MRTTIQGDPTDPRHGSENGYKNLGCRCRLCREAHALSWRTAQRARGVGFRADLEDERHGTSNGYCNLYCRCDRCCAAGHYGSKEKVAP